MYLTTITLSLLSSIIFGFFGRKIGVTRYDLDLVQ